MSGKIVALLSVLLFLIQCQKELTPFLSYVEQLEVSPILKSMQNVHLNFTPGRQRVEFGFCKEGQSSGKKAFPLVTDSVWSLAVPENASPDSVEIFVKQLKKLENIFKALEFGSDILSANAMDNCGETFLLSFKSGEILVHSNANIDNIIGFQYRRTVLKDNWSLYQLK